MNRDNYRGDSQQNQRQFEDPRSQPNGSIPSNRSYPEELRSTQYQGNQPGLQPSNLGMDDRLNARGNSYGGLYPKPPLQQPGSGSGALWGDNFGQNSVHNRIQQEYKDYVKTYDSNKLSYGSKVPLNHNVGPYGEDKNRSPLRKKNLDASNNQADSWYVQNYNVGILPGMGSGSEGRKPARMPTYDPKPLQNRQIEQYEG